MRTALHWMGGQRLRDFQKKEKKNVSQNSLLHYCYINDVCSFQMIRWKYVRLDDNNVTETKGKDKL